jgi:hypothetical protein
MKHIKLNNFKRQEKKLLKITSIKLRPDQLTFIKDNEVNLSQLVRALLDNFIKKTNNKG